MEKELLYVFHYDEDGGNESGDVDELEEVTDEEVEVDAKFTQAEVDKIVGERLARAKKKAQEEADEKAALEAGEYKELYEKAIADAAAKDAEHEADKLNRLKTDLIVAAGYGSEQAALIKKLVDGEDADAIQKSIEEVAKAFPVKDDGNDFVDPSLGNGHRSKPTPQKDSEYGKSLYDRIKK